jgi:hypothetical protein
MAAADAGAIERRPLLSIPGAAERLDAAGQDARRLVATRFPSVDDLGPGWRRPWQASRDVPGMPRTEDEFWRATRMSPVWAQFFEMPEPQVQRAVRQSIDKILAESRAVEARGGKIHPLVHRFATPEGLLALSAMQLRLFALAVYDSPLVAGARLNDIGAPFLERVFGAESDEARETALVEWTAAAVDTESRTLEGQPFEKMLETYAREARRIRRGATMVYVHVAERPASAAPADPAPPFGQFTVDLWILSRDTVGTQVRDHAAGDLARTRSAVESTLQRVTAAVEPRVRAQVKAQLAQLEEQIGQHLAADREPPADLFRRRSDLALALAELEQARPVAVTMEPRHFGDNSWIAFVDGYAGVPALGGELRGYFARLRNGNAVVNVRGTGTYPRAWFLQQLDLLLSAMADRTEIFRNP